MKMQYNSDLTKRKLLDAAVQLFLDQGYHKTRIKDIYENAGVPSGSFYNAFKSKESILYDLVGYMFDSQFDKARAMAGEDVSPLFVYGLETSIQLAMTELSENLRDIYLEAYSYPETAEYIYRHTALELGRIFGPYMPGASEADFYETDIASAGIMRGYMSVPCTQYFTLEHKISRFLSTSFAVFGVPKEETAQIIEQIISMDPKPIAAQLVTALTEELKQNFSLDKAG